MKTFARLSPGCRTPVPRADIGPDRSGLRRAGKGVAGRSVSAGGRGRLRVPHAARPWSRFPGRRPVQGASGGLSRCSRPAAAGASAGTGRRCGATGVTPDKGAAARDVPRRRAPGRGPA